MSTLSFTRSTLKLLGHLLQGIAYAVSNGSCYSINKTGSCPWIMSTPDRTEWIQGGGLILGYPEDQDSYHSELGGQLGVAAVTSAIILPNR